MTIIFERRQINDRFLIVQFQFDSYDVKGSDSYSLDKYIGLDLWSQIYRKLNAPLEKYKSNIETQLKGEIISMRRAQLELKLKWRNKQQFHREVVNQEMEKCQLCPFVLIVTISVVSLINKYKNQLFQDSVDSTVNVEEYVPSGITTATKNLNYTPSSTGVEKVDEYTPPKSIKSDPDIITYTPTKIDENKSYKKQNHKHKSNIKTDLIRNDCPEKKKCSNDLFGDSDHKVNTLNCRENLRSAKKATDIENGASNDTPKKHKINKIVPIEEKHCKNKQNEKDEEAKKLKELREKWEEMDEKNVVIDQILNLYDMTFDEISATLPQNEKSLRDRIQSNINIPDHLIMKIAAEYWDYLLILDGLVTSDQQKYIYTQLRQKFFRNETDAMTNHENLLWCFLVPQWSLQIFMHKYILTKDAAIRRLKDQDRASIQDSELGASFKFFNQ